MTLTETKVVEQCSECSPTIALRVKGLFCSPWDIFFEILHLEMDSGTWVRNLLRDDVAPIIIVHSLLTILENGAIVYSVF